MDPGEEPDVIRLLTQVEEMLITWVNLVLHVSHARGGQYKSSGDTLIFPQGISSIARKLLGWFENLYFLLLEVEVFNQNIMIS